MKISKTIKTETTTIEATASELRESNTLAQNMSMMLSRILQNKEPIEDEDEGETGEELDE